MWRKFVDELYVPSGTKADVSYGKYVYLECPQKFPKRIYPSAAMISFNATYKNAKLI